MSQSLPVRMRGAAVCIGMSWAEQEVRQRCFDGLQSGADAIERLQRELKMQGYSPSQVEWITQGRGPIGPAPAIWPDARQREIKALEQVVRLNPAEYDPSVATCPCGVCQHYRTLFRQQGTPLDQLGKPNAPSGNPHA